MKKLFLGAFVVGAFCNSASAGQIDDTSARLDAIEKENAAIRKENAALLENKKLHEQNSKLRSEAGLASRRSVAAKTDVVVAPVPSAALPPRSPVFANPRELPKNGAFGAYAADLPVKYKAVESPGVLRVWGEGGAIWTGGDRVLQNLEVFDFSNPAGVLVGLQKPGLADLTPKVGWEGAAGFDYRFANSPWHVNMQFRYGEGGKTSGSNASSGSFDFNNNNVADPFNATGTFAGSDTSGATYKEQHWLADFAGGYDITSGRTALQVKAGIRIGAYTDNLNTSDNFNGVFNFNPAVTFNTDPPFSVVSANFAQQVQSRDSFLGAGPRIGFEGSIPFAGRWTLDYLGDAAVLFGTERTVTNTLATSSLTPAFLSGNSQLGIIGELGQVGLLGNGVQSNQRFSSVFSGDAQVGVGYWFTPNVKLAASYRLDTMIHVQNQSSSSVFTLTPDRYWHGPRLTLSGQFGAPDSPRTAFDAYGADLPLKYKAEPLGVLRLWGEGGAIWTGGDRVSQDASVVDFSNPLFFENLKPGVFDLTQKVGWEGAGGFDYQFAGSPYHFNMQFRYGEGGKTSGSNASSGTTDIATLLATLNTDTFFSATGGAIGGSQTLNSSYKEKHWLTDFAVGYDVISGPAPLQVKGGIRMAEYVDNLTQSTNLSEFLNFNPLVTGDSSFAGLSSISTNFAGTVQTRDSFLGAGPRLGLEGSIPFAGSWTLDYLGDAAILFGTERSSMVSQGNVALSTPAALSLLALQSGFFDSTNFVVGTDIHSQQRFASVFSGDVQVGVGYWITPYMKLAASYRLDAMIHVQNQSNPGVQTLTPDRYWHGPRLTLTGQFGAP